MPLYIRDETVAELAREVKQATGAKTVTEAVRSALESELANRRKLSLRERIEAVVKKADAMGPSDPTFDFKTFRRELWGDD